MEALSLKNIRAHMAQECASQTALPCTIGPDSNITAGASLACLMLGWEVQLPLDRLKAKGTASPATGQSLRKQTPASNAALFRPETQGQGHRYKWVTGSVPGHIGAKRWHHTGVFWHASESCLHFSKHTQHLTCSLLNLLLASSQATPRAQLSVPPRARPAYLGDFV